MTSRGRRNFGRGEGGERGGSERRFCGGGGGVCVWVFAHPCDWRAERLCFAAGVVEPACVLGLPDLRGFGRGFDCGGSFGGWDFGGVFAGCGADCGGGGGGVFVRLRRNALALRRPPASNDDGNGGGWREGGGKGGGKGGSETLKAAALTTLALTWLNPHVYLDTVLLLGGISARFAGWGRIFFGLGAIASSFIFFFSLGYGARRLAPIFARPSAWRILDATVAVVMFAIAARLTLAALEGGV